MVLGPFENLTNLALDPLSTRGESYIASPISPEIPSWEDKKQRES
jgi:hypothetical protein